MIQYILFDLGFVLVELDGMPFVNAALSHTEMHRQWISLQSVRDFETGKISEAEFFHQAHQELKLEVSREQFVKRYLTWVRGPYPEAEQLILRLKQNYRVGCLSNTNITHINHLNAMGSFLDHFDDRFYSYEIAAIKPDVKSYQHVLQQIRHAPEQVLFIDDSEDNIAAARQLGIQACQAKGFDAVQNVLKNHLQHFQGTPE